MGQYLSAPVVEKDVAEGEIVIKTVGTKVVYGISSHQGWRKSMEDAHLVHVHGGGDICVFGVFDGHGGAEVARFAARHLPLELCKSAAFQQGKYEDALIAAFHRVDELLPHSLEELEELRQMDNENSEEGENTFDVLRRLLVLQQKMAGRGVENEAETETTTEEAPQGLRPAKPVVNAGCTAVVALLVGKELYVANAGDSRAVVCRGGKAVAMSKDHKPSDPSERQRIIAAGGFLSDFGGICRVNGNLALSRALGDLSYKMNADLHPRDQIITAEPDIEQMSITKDDEFLVIACDGIFDVKDNQEVVDFVAPKLKAGIAPTVIASELLNACLASDPRESRGIGADNMTCQIIVFEHDHHHFSSS